MSSGTYVPKKKLTVDDLCKNYLAGQRHLKESALDKLTYDLGVWRSVQGGREVQSLEKVDIDHLVTALIDGGTATDKGRTRKAWKPATVNKTLEAVSAVLKDAEAQGIIARNPAEHVKRARSGRRSAPVAMTKSEVEQLYSAIGSDRLAHAWTLALTGLRRAEVLGLRWSDVDFDAAEGLGTITIQNTRVAVGKTVVEGDTKTATSTRVLPMTPRVRQALKDAQVRQSAEADTLESLYGTKDARGYPRRTRYRDAGYVVMSEVGEPYAPTSLYRLWIEMLDRHKLRRVKLHAARATFATLEIERGTPVTVVAQWLGHRSADTLFRHYATTNQDAMIAAAKTML
ncbi:tyrosine-type recombinase/integrase [Gordonia sp. NPDC003950]